MHVAMKIPALGESISEVTISQWLKKDGEAVAMDEVIAELESDKATFELRAEQAGILRYAAQAGSTLAIGELVCTIEPGENLSQVSKAESLLTTEDPIAASSVSSTTEKNTVGLPSPAAAKILAEKNIDPSSISGSGSGGRITKEDALKASINKDISSPVQATKESPPASKTQEPIEEHREKMSPLRKTIAKRLVAVKNETALLTTFNEVDMSAIMSLRATYKEKFKEKHGVGLGLMSFFVKAVCEALKDFPTVGARIEGDEIIWSDFVDISIAVSAPKGLLVPVIRHANTLSLAEIEQAVVGLATKARENKLTPEEMSGGAFTITNGGIFGSMLSTPIINAPQSAILGMHNIVERPIAKNGQVVIRPIMYLALSYDHRIIDGRESVRFLVQVKQFLEEPSRLLLGI